MESVKELAESYRFDKKLRMYYGNQSHHGLHASIKTHEDVERYFYAANHTIEQLNKNYDLVEEDIDMLKEDIVNYEVAVNKVIQLISDLINPGELNCSVDELQRLIDNVFILQDKTNKIIHRKLFQD